MDTGTAGKGVREGARRSPIRRASEKGVSVLHAHEPHVFQASARRGEPEVHEQPRSLRTKSFSNGKLSKTSSKSHARRRAERSDLRQRGRPAATGPSHPEFRPVTCTSAGRQARAVAPGGSQGRGTAVTRGPERARGLSTGLRSRRSLQELGLPVEAAVRHGSWLPRHGPTAPVRALRAQAAPTCRAGAM